MSWSTLWFSVLHKDTSACEGKDFNEDKDHGIMLTLAELDIYAQLAVVQGLTYLGQQYH